MLLPLWSKVRYTPLTEKPWPNRQTYINILKYLGFISLASVLLLAVLHVSGVKRLSIPKSDPIPNEEPVKEEEDPLLGTNRGPEIHYPEIPKTFETIAVVFYGRKTRVEILDCYLKANLKENGGLLDAVHFVVKTTEPADVEWLDKLIPTSESYKKLELEDPKADHKEAWRFFERGKMYLKIDDDMVFLDKDCIKEMIAAKVAHPEHLFISANIINNPALSWVHYHQDAVLPYLPEQVKRPRNDTPSWRASKLPVWQDAALFDRREKMDPPFDGHRWLPLPPGYTLDGTPITTTAYDPYGTGWWNWPVAAQMHYSFLDHLERDNLKVYDFGTWDYHYGRLSINMLAFWGDDIVDNYPFSPDYDDEYWLAIALPERLARHIVMPGKAVAVHYSFAPQRIGLESTDLLARYKAYAEEFICKK